MVMRLPESGSWLGSLLSSLGGPVNPGADGVEVDSVDEPQLLQALESMANGDIEFVILEDGEQFLQAAGDGDGPYQLEYQGDGNVPLLAVSGGVNRQTLQRAMLAYRRRERGWRDAHAWVAPQF